MGDANWPIVILYMPFSTIINELVDKCFRIVNCVKFLSDLSLVSNLEHFKSVLNLCVKTLSCLQPHIVNYFTNYFKIKSPRPKQL